MLTVEALEAYNYNLKVSLIVGSAVSIQIQSVIYLAAYAYIGTTEGFEELTWSNGLSFLCI